MENVYTDEELLAQAENEKEREEIAAAIEHRDLLIAINSVLATDAGKRLFKYLFKSLDVGNVPLMGMEGNALHDYLGFLRAGNSIYKVTVDANPLKAAEIMAQVEKEYIDDQKKTFTV